MAFAELHIAAADDVGFWASLVFIFYSLQEFIYMIVLCTHVCEYVYMRYVSSLAAVGGRFHC